MKRTEASGPSEDGNDGIVNAGDKFIIRDLEKMCVLLVVLFEQPEFISKRFMVIYSTREGLLGKPC